MRWGSVEPRGGFLGCAAHHQAFAASWRIQRTRRTSRLRVWMHTAIVIIGNEMKDGASMMQLCVIDALGVRWSVRTVLAPHSSVARKYFPARRPIGSQTVRVPKRFRSVEVLLLHQIPSSRTETVSVRGGVASIQNIIECEVDAGVLCQCRAVKWHGQCPSHFLPEHHRA